MNTEGHPFNVLCNNWTVNGDYVVRQKIFMIH